MVRFIIKKKNSFIYKLKMIVDIEKAEKRIAELDIKIAAKHDQISKIVRSLESTTSSSLTSKD